MRRFNLVALIIFIAALVWVFLLPAETTRSIQQTIGSLFSPFTKTGGKVQDALTGMDEVPKTPEELARENKQLTQEVEELRVRQKLHDDLQQEVQDLRELLEFRRRYKLKLIPAQIKNRKISTWYRQALIDKGSDHGVADGTPVLTPIRRVEGEGVNEVVRYDAALVGRVGKTLSDNATVVFLTDEQCSVSATIKGRAQVHGILMGSRSSIKAVPDLRLRFISPQDITLPQDVDVISEDAGELGIFPYGFLLGTIKEFQPNDGNPEALVRPAVNFETLRYVFVLQLEKMPAELATPTAATPPKPEMSP